jgi:hypothetical protein
VAHGFGSAAHLESDCVKLGTLVWTGAVRSCSSKERVNVCLLV